MIRLGLLYVLAVPIGAGLASIEGWSIGGFNYTGWLWMSFLAGGLAVVGIEKAIHKFSPTPFPYWPWILWFGFVWASLIWRGDDLRRGVQDALQISMPLVVGIASSLFIRTSEQFRLLAGAFAIGSLMICTSLAAGRLGIISLDPEAPGLRCAVRVVSLSLTISAAVALGAFPRAGFPAIAGWASCMVVTAISGSRIATLAILGILAAHPGIGRLRWRVVAMLAIPTLGLALFYTPVFQTRFFYSGSGTLADVWEGKFDDAGRFYAWRAILPEIVERPWIGRGVGAIHQYVPTVWPEAIHIHNDYLRIAFEWGLVGLAIFTLVAAWQLLDLGRGALRSQGVACWAFTAAFLGLIAFLLAAVTDNPLMYNLWLTNPLFALIGACYGLSAGASSVRPVGVQPLESEKG